MPECGVLTKRSPAFTSHSGTVHSGTTSHLSHRAITRATLPRARFRTKIPPAQAKSHRTRARTCRFPPFPALITPTRPPQAPLCLAICDRRSRSRGIGRRSRGMRSGPHGMGCRADGTRCRPRGIKRGARGIVRCLCGIRRGSRGTGSRGRQVGRSAKIGLTAAARTQMTRQLGGPAKLAQTRTTVVLR